MTPYQAATRAAILIRTGCTDLAEYDRLIAKFPRINYLKAAKGEAAFKAGDIKTGFDLCKYRWALSGMIRANVSCPEWDGKSEHHMIVICEQGLGEQILLSTMFRDLPPATIATDPRLIPLFARSFPQHAFIRIGDIPEHETPDCRHVYTMDLAAMRLGDRNPTSWLKHDTARAAVIRSAMLEEFGHTTNVGLSWRSHNTCWGGEKSIDRETLLPLVRDHRITAFSLQYGYDQTDAVFWNVNGQNVKALSGLDTSNDLDGVATFMGSLDVVVTCSNTVAHLAGALGVPTILIIPSAFNLWYWGAGDRTPWYPSVRIIRQPAYSTLAETVITLRDQTST